MTIIHVPADYPTINQAIAASSSGDTIIVAPGTYNEQVNINVSNLTLQGAQAGIDARTRTFVPADESIITFASPAFGSGIINLSQPDTIINGFTIQGTGSIVNSTSAIFGGDIGTFLPSTSSLNLTGLQIINNIIQNNANGILIASTEPTSSPINYLVQFNYLYNNSGDPGSGNGQGVFFNNSAGTTMSNVLITQNLFNGLETSSSVNLSNILNSNITNNVMNQDNSIAIFGTNGITINGNVTYQATGITPTYPTNTASAIFIGFGSINTTITNNLIVGATNTGISIYSDNSNLTITNNCIVNNTTSGISITEGSTFNASTLHNYTVNDPPSWVSSTQELSANTGIIVNNNNIIQSISPGVILNPGSYTGILNATDNYWNSASGPNYNTMGPGTGSAITDNNIPSVQSITFEPFLTGPITCPSPLTLSKTTTSINVDPGMPVSFDLSFTVASNQVPFVVNSFTDTLPVFTSGASWNLTTQTPAGFFTIIGSPGSQQLTITTPLPTTIVPGTYSVTITADTELSDFGEVLTNMVTIIIQFPAGVNNPGLTQTITATATASVAACIHGSSNIRLADGTQLEISKISPGALIAGLKDESTPIIEAIPCWAGLYNKIFTSCVIFEPDSLGYGVPNSRFAIDAGHPMCTPQEYNGEDALRPAKTYLNTGIYLVKWDEVEKLLPGENKRYDIIMPQDSSKIYIANGIVVKARQERRITGYDYE